MPKHEKRIVILLLISLVLILLSLYPCIKCLSGVLQGVSTGILSGTVLLYVTGIKNQEQRRLQSSCKAIVECIALVYKIMFIRGPVDSQNESSIDFSEYYDWVFTDYSALKDGYDALKSVDTSLMPETASTALADYINMVNHDLEHIDSLILEAKNKGDVVILTTVHSKIYLLSDFAAALFPVMMTTGSLLYDERDRINSSLF